MVGVGGRGQAGVSGGPPPGQLSPALGWLERTAGKVALGSPPSWRRVHHRQVLQLPSPSPPPPHPTPAAALAESESRAKGARPVAVLSPLPTLPTAGHAGVFWGAAPPRARPLSHPGPRADCPQCALGRSYHRAGGLFFGHAGRGSEHTGLVVMSATHPTYLETRTKESNTCTSQGLAQKPPWCNEGEGRLSQQPRWDPEASPVCQGSTTGLSHPPRWGGGVWSHVLGPERW